LPLEIGSLNTYQRSLSTFTITSISVALNSAFKQHEAARGSHKRHEAESEIETPCSKRVMKAAKDSPGRAMWSASRVQQGLQYEGSMMPAKLVKQARRTIDRTSEACETTVRRGKRSSRSGGLNLNKQTKVSRLHKSTRSPFVKLSLWLLSIVLWVHLGSSEAFGQSSGQCSVCHDTVAYNNYSETMEKWRRNSLRMFASFVMFASSACSQVPHVLKFRVFSSYACSQECAFEPEVVW